MIVSTPQEVALIDARRAVAMFGKFQTPVPVLGIVENMAYFSAPGTDEPIPIFGRGGAKAEAKKLGVPFLGEIPIDMALREASDAGKPLTAVQPDSATARAFVKIAEVLRPRRPAGFRTDRAPARPAGPSTRGRASRPSGLRASAR